MSMEADIAAGCRRLMEAHVEIETLAQRLDRDRRCTVRLLHWCGVSLRSWDGVTGQGD
jgi:hypothetical protein